MAFIFSQLAVFVVLHTVGLINLFGVLNFGLICVSLLLTCLVEGFTNDNDNLMTPIVAYPFLRMVDSTLFWKIFFLNQMLLYFRKF